MKTLFWGLFFVLIDFNLTINQFTINLLPEFVGYFLLARGMTEMAAEEESFQKGWTMCYVLLIGTAVGFLFDLCGVRVPHDGSVMEWLMLTVPGLLYTAGAMYVLWTLVSGVQQLERRQNRDLRADHLHTTWLVIGAGYLVSLLGSFGWNSGIVGVAFLAGMVLLVASICFLVFFHQTRKRYEEPRTTPEPVETQE